MFTDIKFLRMSGRSVMFYGYKVSKDVKEERDVLLI